MSMLERKFIISFTKLPPRIKLEFPSGQVFRTIVLVPLAIFNVKSCVYCEEALDDLYSVRLPLPLYA